MKFLILLVIVWAIVVWFKKFKKNLLNQQGGAQTKATSTIAARSQEGEKMVQCEYCGVHFPSSEVVTDIAGHIYCCDEHRRLGSHS